MSWHKPEPNGALGASSIVLIKVEEKLVHQTTEHRVKIGGNLLQRSFSPDLGAWMWGFVFIQIQKYWYKAW